VADVRKPIWVAALAAALACAAPLGAGVRVAPIAADTCDAATYETGTLPFDGGSDTTVGQTDDLDLPTDVVEPTCTAPTSCTGGGPAESLPRGGVFTGSGTGPDRAYRIRVDQSCSLAITATPEASWDLGVVVFEAGCSSSLADCACIDDDDSVGAAESVTLDAVAGLDYFVVVDGYSTGATPPGPSGPFNLSIAETTATGCALIDPSPTTTSTTTISTTTSRSTSTVPPDPCDTVAPGASFASIHCRIAGAIDFAAGVPSLAPRIGRLLERARAAEQAAQDLCRTPNVRKARKQVSKTARALVRVRRLVRKSRDLEPGVRDQLVAEASALVADVRARKRELACPGDAP
jgi:hypothetical protein